jgi:hypothetical protein
MSHTAAIREMLHDNPDVIRASEIHKAMPDITRVTTIMRVLHRMPDVYIDRWVLGQGNRGQFEAVWCAVARPANCPYPTDRKFRPKTHWVKTTAQLGAMH